MAGEWTEYAEGLARRAKTASRSLSVVPGRTRNAALQAIARLLREEGDSILAANEKDIAAAPEFGLSSAQIDRLRLSEKRLAEMASAVEEIAAMADPLGKVLDSSVRPNGLEIRKITVPLGVILFIYESRPNVTTDAAALCIKSGNAVILRGGKEARHSNLAVGAIVKRGLEEAGICTDCVSVVEHADREIVGALLQLDRYIDVAIPRGGESLIRRVATEATMPVLKHYQGICHVYVDRAADAEWAMQIIENAKCSRPGVCNAAETLLIHREVADTLLPRLASRLMERGVELRGCEKTCSLVSQAKPATEADYATEWLDLILSVRVVDSLEQAIEHIDRFASGHTETIVTGDLHAARTFTARVDSSAVMVNASTRFNDGGQFGLGAEIGISTDKFHARGPCGVAELTSYKYIVYGDGQIRQ